MRRSGLRESAAAVGAKLGGERFSGARRRAQHAGTVELLEPRALLTVFTVTSRFDTLDPDDGLLTLREAILAANDETAHPGRDEIRFADELAFSMIHADYSGFEYVIDRQTGKEVRQGVQAENSGGQYTISSDLLIDAASVGFVRVGHERGFNQYHRIFEITAEADVEMRSVFVQGGDSNNGNGAGFYNAGRLTLRDSAVGGNFALGDQGGTLKGGGIYNGPSGELTLDNTHIGEIRLDSELLTGIGFDADRYAAAEEDERTQYRTFVYRGEDIIGKSTTETTFISGNASYGSGGGIYNDGTLSVRNGSVIRANRAAAGLSRGSGLYNAGDAVIEDSVVEDHVVFGEFSQRGADLGGGIYNAASGDLTLRRSTVRGNSATAAGGGIYSLGKLQLEETAVDGNQVAVPSFNSEDGVGGNLYLGGGATTLFRTTVSRGTADLGGGIAISATTTAPVGLTLSTVAGNTAEYGGGLYTAAQGFGDRLHLNSSTIAQNSATVQGGGLWGGGALLAENSLIASGTAPNGSDLVWGNPVASGGHNLLGSDQLSNWTPAGDGSDVINMDAEVGELGAFGGVTETVPLRLSSPAVDRGATTLTTDQRGVGRPVGYASDIGAFEFEPPEQMTVDSLSDLVDGYYGPGEFTLREAVEWANHLPGTDGIRFSPDLFTGGSAEIVLTEGELVISDDLTLIGPGADKLTLRGAGHSRLLDLAADVGLSVTDVSLAAGIADIGGAIRSAGELTARRVRIHDSRATSGGGIFSTGQLSLIDSTLDGNAATGGAGGAVRAGGDVLLENSTLSGNSAETFGGAIQLDDQATAALNSVTITANVAGIRGGGIDTAATTVPEVLNSLIAGNTAPAGSDLGASVSSSLGHNLIGIGEDGAGFVDGVDGDQVGAEGAPLDPLLGRLAFIGGGVPVHGLLPGSPAIETGSSNTGLRFDQRGIARPQQSATESGSFEYEPPVFGSNVITVSSTDGFADGRFDQGFMSLPEAILFAAADPSLDRIEFSPALFASGQKQTIRLETADLRGMFLAGDVEIIGPGAHLLEIQGNRGHRIFTVGDGVAGFPRVTLQGLAMSGVSEVAAGGALLNHGILTLNQVYVHGNSAAAGGGLLNLGYANIYQSTFSGNTASVDGGAIANSHVLRVENSTISGNSAGTAGGGVSMRSGGFARMTHTTVTKNHAERGGGIAAPAGTEVRTRNSLIAGNQATLEHPDIHNDGDSFVSPGGNLIGVGDHLQDVLGLSDHRGTAATPLIPLMTDLTYVQGSVIPIHSLLPQPGGNRAVDGALTALGLPVDQRGFSRPAGDLFDIGALEITAAEAAPYTWQTTLVVSETGDVVDGDFSDNDLSLREALILTNAFNAQQQTFRGLYGHDLVTFAPGLFAGASADAPLTIQLSRGALRTSDHLILDPMAAGGNPDSGRVRIVGNGADRVLHAERGIAAGLPRTLLKGVTLEGGVAAGDGGAILSTHYLTLQDSVVRGNSAAKGGGIAVEQGSVTLLETEVHDNTAVNGGAIYAAAGSLDIDRSWLHSNTATGAGGAIYSYGNQLEIHRTTISSNEAAEGGGLYLHQAKAYVTAATVSDNAAAVGGGIHATVSVLDLANVTITENRVTTAGSRAGAFYHERSGIDAVNTIIAGNTRPGGSASDGLHARRARIVSSGGNLFGDISGYSPPGGDGFYIAGPGDLTGADPMTGPLADNGGFGPTHRLLPGSPAIDAGNDAFLPITDQRGQTVTDIDAAAAAGASLTDIGAYEVQRIEAAPFRLRTGGSQFGPGEALTYGFGFHDGSAHSKVSADPKFLGYTWDTGPLTYGGIETGPLGGKYGGVLDVDFSGRLGFDLGFYLNSGSVDVAYEGAVNYLIDTAPDLSQAVVSGFVDLQDGSLSTISPKIGAYMDLVIELDLDVSATGCLVGCATADLLDIHVDTGMELLGINRQMEDDAGRPLFLNDFGEPVALETRRGNLFQTGHFYDLDGNRLGTLADVGPVVPLFDGDVRYLELPIQEIAEGVIKAAKTAREKVRDVLESRKASKELDDANKAYDEADTELTRQNEALADAEARQRNPASGADYLAARDEVTERAGIDYANAVDSGEPLPQKKGTVGQAEDALIDAHRRRQNAEEKVSRRKKPQDAERRSGRSKLRSQGLGLVLNLGEAEGPLLGAELGIDVGLSAGPFSFTRNLGKIQATIPDVNLTDGTPDADGHLSASTDDFRPHSDQDERRQLAAAFLDIGALIPGLPDGRFNVSAGPLSLDLTTVSYNLGPQLNVTQDVTAQPVTGANALNYALQDEAGNPIASVVTVNGVPLNGGAPVYEFALDSGDEFRVDGVNYDGITGNDVIVVQPSLEMGARFSNDIGLDVELQGTLEALAMQLSAFDVSIIDVGPLIRNTHTLAGFDIGSVFERVFDLPSQRVSLAPFRLFDRVSDGKTATTALRTQPTNDPDVLQLDLTDVTAGRPVFIRTDMAAMLPNGANGYAEALELTFSGENQPAADDVFVVDDRLQVVPGEQTGQFLVTGFDQAMFDDVSDVLMAVRFPQTGSASVSAVRQSLVALVAPPATTEGSSPITDDGFDQAGVRAVLSNDIDGSGTVAAESDGVLLMRYLAGFRGDALTQGVLANNATRTDPEAVGEYISELMNTTYLNARGGISETLDLDDSGGATTTLGDGLMLYRYLAGMRGPQLTADLLDPTALRTDAAQVLAWIEYGRSTADEENGAAFREAADRTGSDVFGLSGGDDVDPGVVAGASPFNGIPGTTAFAETRLYDLLSYNATVPFREVYSGPILPENLASRSAVGTPTQFGSRSQQQLIRDGGEAADLRELFTDYTLGTQAPLFVSLPDAEAAELSLTDASFDSLILTPEVGGQLYIPDVIDIYDMTSGIPVYLGTLSQDDPDQVRDDGLVSWVFPAGDIRRIQLYGRVPDSSGLFNSENLDRVPLSVPLGLTLRNVQAAAPVLEHTVLQQRQALTDEALYKLHRPVSSSDLQPRTATFAVDGVAGGTSVQANVHPAAGGQPVLTVENGHTSSLRVQGHDHTADTFLLSESAAPLAVPLVLDGGFRFDQVIVTSEGTDLDISRDPQKLVDAQRSAATSAELYGIEQIDLRGAGAQKLYADADAIVQNDPDRFRLRVRRDADDSVALDGHWEQFGDEFLDDVLFERWVSGRAELLLESVSQNAPPALLPAAAPRGSQTPALYRYDGTSDTAAEPPVIGADQPPLAAAADVPAIRLESQADLAPDDNPVLVIRWAPEAGDPLIAGLNLFIHYDSSQIEAPEISGVLATGFDIVADAPETAEQDDHRTETDRVLQLFWFDTEAAWPGVPTDSVLAEVSFRRAAAFTETTVYVTAYGSLDQPLSPVSTQFRQALKPRLLSPDSRVTTAQPAIRWTATPGVSHYDVWVTNRSTATSPYLRVDVSDTEWVPTGDLSLGEYRVWVNAVMPSGNDTGWSQGRTFFVETRVGNVRPALTTTARPEISWSPITGAGSYALRVDALYPQRTAVYEAFSLTTTQVTLPDPLPLGNYEVTIHAKGEYGVDGTSAVNVPMAVRTQTEVLEPATNPAGPFPAFSWLPIAGAERYDLWIDSLTSGTLRRVWRDTQLTTTAAIADVPLDLGLHQVWVRGINAQGIAGYWSEPLAFVVESVGKLTGPGASVATSRPVITWEPIPGAVDYQLWINERGANYGVRFNEEGLPGPELALPFDLNMADHSAWVRGRGRDGTYGRWSPVRTFRVETAPTVVKPSEFAETSPVTVEWESVAGADDYELVLFLNETTRVELYRRSGLTETEHFIPLTLPFGRHEIHVRARAANGIVGQWQVHEFVVGAAPELTAPIRSTFDLTPLFLWSPVAGAVRYDLRVTRLTVDPGVVLQVDNLPALRHQATEEFAGGSYRIEVRGRSSVGTPAAWSEPVDVFLGGRTTLSGPSGEQETPTPVFSWDAVDGAGVYDLWVESQDGGPPVIRESVAATTYTPSSSLAAGRYRFWVRAIATDGTLGWWSLRGDFAIL